MRRRDASDRHRLRRSRAAARSPAAAARSRSRRASRPPTEGAVLFNERCSGCHTFDAGERLRLEAEEPAPGRRAHQRAELQRAQGEPRRRALRDPQRRLLGRDHARERGDGRRGRRGRRLPRQVLGQEQLARGGVAMLDLRQIREDPQPAREALARARRRPGAARRGARARRAPPRAAARARGAARAQEPGQQADRRAAAERRGRVRGDRRGQAGVSRAREGARGGAARGRGAARRRARGAAEPARPDRAAEDEVLREVGEAGQDRAATTWSCWASTSTWSAPRACPARASST